MSTTNPPTPDHVVIQHGDDVDAPCPTDDDLTCYALAALPEDDVPVTLRIVNEAEIQALNHEYRHKDKPTNVLSFPFEVPPGLPQETLGDVILCAPVINREADEQHKTTTAHWALMVIHGILHLQGFDHIDDNDATIMIQREIDILTTLGFDNPYGDLP